MRGLTDKQRLVLDAICALCSRDRAAPTLAVIGKHVKRPKSAIHRYVKQLVARGALTVGGPNQRRSLWPTPQGWALAGICPPEDPADAVRRRTEYLERENARLRTENEGLKVRLARLSAAAPCFEVA